MITRLPPTCICTCTHWPERISLYAWRAHRHGVKGSGLQRNMASMAHGHGSLDARLPWPCASQRSRTRTPWAAPRGRIAGGWGWPRLGRRSPFYRKRHMKILKKFTNKIQYSPDPIETRSSTPDGHVDMGSVFNTQHSTPDGHVDVGSVFNAVSLTTRIGKPQHQSCKPQRRSQTPS